MAGAFPAAATPVKPGQSRPPRALLEYAVHFQLDPIVVEGDEPGDSQALGQGMGIRPDQILVHSIAEAQRPVRRLTLVRAARDGIGRLEQVDAHVDLREVVAHRQAGLEQQPRPVRFSDDLAVYYHTNVARAGE